MGTVSVAVIVNPDNAHIGRLEFILEKGELIRVDGVGIVRAFIGGGVLV